MIKVSVQTGVLVRALRFCLNTLVEAHLSHLPVQT